MTALLHVDHLGKRFRGLQAVEDLTFSLAEGEILGIIGPNGAGKTTAINLISGMMRPDRGRVLFNGADVTAMPADALVRRGVVRTFQATTVYQDRTVRENVFRGAFAHGYAGVWHSFLGDAAARTKRRKTEEAVNGLMEALGLAGMAGSIARNLPYGHQKVLGLAVALAAKPRLMMLDEPAAGLSHDEVVQLGNVIRRTNEAGVTLIVVDHNMRFIASLCRRVVVMHHGAELATGTPGEVTRDPRVIDAYLGTAHEPA